MAAKLQRWAVLLGAYNCVLEYRSTTDMGNTDALSCLPVDRASNAQEVTYVMLVDTHQLSLQHNRSNTFKGIARSDIW